MAAWRAVRTDDAACSPVARAASAPWLITASAPLAVCAETDLVARTACSVTAVPARTVALIQCCANSRWSDSSLSAMSKTPST